MRSSQGYHSSPCYDSDVYARTGLNLLLVEVLYVKMSVVHATRTAGPAALAFGSTYIEDLHMDLHICPFNIDDSKRELITLCPLKPVRVAYPFSHNLTLFSIIDSRNGLLLLHEEDKAFDFWNGEGTLCIWNPSTGVSMVLPQDTPLEVPGGGVALPQRSPLECGEYFEPLVNYGFIYDSTSDDYKVLKLAYFCKLVLHLGGELRKEYFIPISEVRIYSLRSNSWRKLQTDALFLPSFEVREFLGPRPNTGGMFLNGALHWIMTVWQSTEAKIISFNVEKEEYREIQKPNSIVMSFPPEYWKPVDILSHLEVLKGSLCIFHNNTIQDYVEVWSMKEYGYRDSWTKLFTVAGPIREYKRMLPFLKMTPCIRPLKCYENGEILMMLEPRDLMIYNPKKDSARFVYRDIEKEFTFEYPINHMETLENPLRFRQDGRGE